jgi:hypothetical protein
LPLLLLVVMAKPAEAQHSDIDFRYSSLMIEIEPSAEGHHVFEGIFPTTGLSTRFTTNPGFGSEIDAGLGIDGDDIIGYNVLDNLFYWNGTAFSSPGSTNITIAHPISSVPDTIVSANSGVQNADLVDGSDGFVNVIDALNGTSGMTADFHQHVDFMLSDGAPFGAYGLLLQLVTDEPGIGPSSPHGILFNYGLSDVEFEAGVEAFAAATAITEPSTLLLTARPGDGSCSREGATDLCAQ